MQNIIYNHERVRPVQDYQSVLHFCQNGNRGRGSRVFDTYFLEKL